MVGWKAATNSGLGLAVSRSLLFYIRKTLVKAVKNQTSFHYLAAVILDSEHSSLLSKSWGSQVVQDNAWYLPTSSPKSDVNPSILNMRRIVSHGKDLIFNLSEIF